MIKAYSYPSRAHDLGGRKAGLIDQTDKPLSLAEKRVDAMIFCLTKGTRKIFTMDEHRYAIERLPPEVLSGTTYYEKWLQGLCVLLIEKKILDPESIERRIVSLKEEGGGDSK